MTVELLLVLALVVVPLVIAGLLVGRKALVAYRASRNFLEQPYAQAYVVDSSPGLPRLLGRVVGYDPFEAPLVVFRDRTTKGGVVLGVRRWRLTSYGEVFYTNDTCDPAREVDEFGQPTRFPKIRAWNASTGTGDTPPAYLYPPDGFLYQNLRTSYAMGNFNILYRSADTESAAVAPAGGLLSPLWAALTGSADAAAPWSSRVSQLGASLLALADRTLTAQTIAYWVFTGQAGAQTQIDLYHSSNWYVIVKPGNTLKLGGGTFTMKGGCTGCPAVVLTLYQGGPGGPILATGTQPYSAYTSQFAPVTVAFPSLPEVSPGVYYLSLTSQTADVGSKQYFIKEPELATLKSADGSTTLAETIATITATPAAMPNLTVNKLAAATVQTSGTIRYRIGLGNDGGATSGTTATIREQLPAGVVATEIDLSPGSAANVSSVGCVPALPSTPGATVTCTVTLTAGIPQAAASGWASFTLVATAPATAGTLTNYVSIDATGGSSPPDPPNSSSCGISNCAQATTVVTSEPVPANFTLNKLATPTVQVGGTITYTLGLGNNGTVTSGSAATVEDQLPPEVIATAVAPGTGVSAVDCGALPSAAGALLTCTVTLTSGLAGGAAAGTAQFTVTATAPDTSGIAANYASVDPTGGSAPPAPGAACSTTSCATASTNVTASRPLYVWKSQDIAPAALQTPSPPCYLVVTGVDNLVSATQVIDFDDWASADNYRLPFRAVFERPNPAPPNPCPTGECP